VQNQLASESLAWHTPFERLTGCTPDISMVTHFKFWDAVYAKCNELRGGKEFLSSSNEIACHFIGFSESFGHPTTYKLTSDTKKVLYCSCIQSASERPNPCANAAARMHSSSPSLDNSTSETFDHSTTPIQSCSNLMAVIDQNDIIGRTYLSAPEEDGTHMRLQIVEALDDINHSINQEDLIIPFRDENDDGTYEEVQTINQILEKIEEEDGEEN